MKIFLVTFTILQFIFLVSISAQQTREVENSADVMEQAQDIADGAYRFLGHARFKREGAIMYSDSAYFIRPKNILEAFSRVHLVQGDTIDLYGDHLIYDGNTKIARILGRVKLVGRNTELRTTELEFNLSTSTGYYTRHADIESGENKLKSRKGYYYSRQEMYFFNDSVVLKNPEYTIYSDTLRYHTPTKDCLFLWPHRDYRRQQLHLL